MFTLWFFSPLRRLEREQARALASLDRAERDFRNACKFLGEIDRMTPNSKAQKSAGMRNVNAARKRLRIAQMSNLAAIDAVADYKKGIR